MVCGLFDEVWWLHVLFCFVNVSCLVEFFKIGLDLVRGWGRCLVVRVLVCEFWVPSLFCVGDCCFCAFVCTFDDDVLVFFLLSNLSAFLSSGVVLCVIFRGVSTCFAILPVLGGVSWDGHCLVVCFSPIIILCHKPQYLFELRVKVQTS